MSASGSPETLNLIGYMVKRTLEIPSMILKYQHHPGSSIWSQCNQGNHKILLNEWFRANDTQKEKAMGLWKRGWRDVAANQRMLAATRNCNRQGMDCPLEPPGGTNPVNT